MNYLNYIALLVRTSSTMPARGNKKRLKSKKNRLILGDSDIANHQNDQSQESDPQNVQSSKSNGIDFCDIAEDRSIRFCLRMDCWRSLEGLDGRLNSNCGGPEATLFTAH